MPIGIVDLLKLSDVLHRLQKSLTVEQKVMLRELAAIVQKMLEIGGEEWQTRS
jgi:hypothetical protein